MTASEYCVGVDLGAGSGAKIGLFTDAHTMVGETLLPADKYGGSAESLTAALADTIRAFLEENAAPVEALRGVGIASPGLFKSDGSYLLAHNLLHQYQQHH